MPSTLANWVAAYLCGLMLILGIIIVVGLLIQKSGKSDK